MRKTIRRRWLRAALPCAFTAAAWAASYPLDPLTADEINATAAILRSAHKTTANSRFALLTLREPPKQDVLAFRPGAPAPRQSFSVVYQRASRQTFEAIVDLNERRVVSWTEVKGVQPGILIEDTVLAEEIVRADPQWQAAMRKRGIRDFENVQVDPWAAGYHGLPEDDGRRTVRGISYYKGSAPTAYVRPIEGVVAYVDLDARKVFKLVDTGVVPLPKAMPELMPPPSHHLKPLEIVQREGVGFDMRDHEVQWDNWRFRFGFHPRDGLVLYNIGYVDHGKTRAILYRASLSEMVVPYGDPGPAWFFRNVFDTGEYPSVGHAFLPLNPGIDAPGNATLLDAVFADESGHAYPAPRAAALFERDGGLLWRYYNAARGRADSRRARELVLSSIMTAGNYEYAFNWVFHQDGTLEMEVLLTGIMTAKGVAGHGTGTHGHLVAENVEAVHHQHFFNFRLDFDIDGPGGNSVVEMNTSASPPGANDPFHKGIVMNETVLRGEREAQRDLSLASARKWKVVNAQHAGYMLIPGENAIPFAAPDSWIRKRAGFINHHVWVTAYDASEMNAAGAYMNQSRGGEGLPKWTQTNRPIENQDIVLWYTMGVTHIPRPEEWPVMPVHKAGFRLAPAGFLSK